MPVVGKWNKSTWLTYASVAAAGTAMYLAFVKNELSCAHVLLLVAAICDMFDGFVARKCKRTAEEKQYGVELDSLADTISFVVTPVVLAFCIGIKEWYEVTIAIFFMICGIARLAFFNILASKDNSKPVKYYRGLPVTVSGFFLPLIFLGISRGLPFEIAPIMYACTLAILGSLNILDFHCPKPKPKVYPVFIAIAILTALGLIFL